MTRHPARSRQSARRTYRPRKLKGLETAGRGVLIETTQPFTGTKETKAEHFNRIMPKRLATALNAMELLKQPFDRETYDYTEAQGKRVIWELVAKVYDVREAFLTGAKVRHRNVLLDDERDIDTLRDDTLDDLKDVL